MSDMRGTGRRAFRPGLDGKLEPRCLMSANRPHTPTVVRGGGRNAIINDSDHEQYLVSVTDAPFASNTPTVLARRVRPGLFDLYVYGSDSNTQLLVTPQDHPLYYTFSRGPKRRLGLGNEFSTGTIPHDSLLHIRNIVVATGQIGYILGYKNTALSGAIAQSVGRTGATAPLSNTPINRIAVFRIDPGGAINTSGDINRLDVFNNISLSGGPGINVGRDLNFLNVGGDLQVGNGSSFTVQRFVGLNPQAANGTAEAGQGGLVQGSMIIGPGGNFTVGTGLVAPFIVRGPISGASRINIGAGGGNLESLSGTIIP